MVARRIAGILMSINLLHLTLGTADATCAAPDSREHSTPAPAHAHQHNETAAAEAPGSQRAPRDTHDFGNLSPCCQMMTSCATVMTMAHGGALGMHSIIADAPSRARVAMPVSPVSGPEPPPPRA
jgi:hypothetical protein